MKSILILTLLLLFNYLKAGEIDGRGVFVIFMATQLVIFLKVIEHTSTS